MKTYHITFIDKSIPEKEIKADGYNASAGFIVFYKTHIDYIKILSFPATNTIHTDVASFNSNCVLAIIELNS